MSITIRYQQIVEALREATQSISRRRIGIETGISPEGLGYWLHRDNANPSINNLIAVEKWLMDNGFIEAEKQSSRRARAKRYAFKRSAKRVGQ